MQQYLADHANTNERGELVDSDEDDEGNLRGFVVEDEEEGDEEVEGDYDDDEEGEGDGENEDEDEEGGGGGDETDEEGVFEG